MEWSTFHLQKTPLAILRYSLPVVSVAMALELALFMQRQHFRDVELPLFLFAVAISAWYAGSGPGLLALVLASACFNYFFTEPR
jgi:K+-sensing histidine kinase KdpD